MRFHSSECRKFLEHWLALPKTGELPHTRDFLANAPFALMPMVYVFELAASGLFIRFMGTTLVDRWRHDYTGHIFGEHMPPRISRILDANARIISEHRCGFSFVGQMSTSSERSVTIENMMLPLAVDAGKPERIVQCSSEVAPRTINEHGVVIFEQSPGQWMDIGYGVPKTPPIAL